MLVYFLIIAVIVGLVVCVRAKYKQQNLNQASGSTNEVISHGADVVDSNKNIVNESKGGRESGRSLISNSRKNVIDVRSSQNTNINTMGATSKDTDVLASADTECVNTQDPKEKKKKHPCAGVAKPYTVVYVPFLSNKFEIDYSQRIYFKYDLPTSKELKYPLLRTPQKGTEIKLPVSGRNGKRGFSEETLCRAIEKYGLQNFYDNLSVVANSYPFEPDLAYIDVDKGIFIDIEVDEPYVGDERKPIHCRVNKDTTDDYRNLCFTERGWIVLRFSERQIVEQCDSCLKHIYEVVQKMDRSLSIPESLVNAAKIKEEDMWTRAMVLSKIANEEREKLLGISKFICSNTGVRAKVSDYKGAQVIEDNLKNKKDEDEWKSCAAQKKWQDYVNKYPHGNFVNQAKGEIDKSLWEESKKQKTYQRYLKETKLGKYKADAENLISEQKRQGEEKHRQELKRIKTIQDEEERKRRENLETQKRREEEERKKREAERYERQHVSTVHSAPKAPSSRAYA